MSTWIIQLKIMRGDWETLAMFNGPRKQALARYERMADPSNYGSTRKLRAVSEKQAEADYQAGRADNFRRKLGEKCCQN